jgi:hypothetical protein
MAKGKEICESFGFDPLGYKMIQCADNSGCSQKELGSFSLLQVLDGLEGFSLRAFTQVRGWTREEVKVFLALVRKDLLNARMQIQHD